MLDLVRAQGDRKFTHPAGRGVRARRGESAILCGNDERGDSVLPIGTDLLARMIPTLIGPAGTLDAADATTATDLEDEPVCSLGCVRL